MLLVVYDEGSASIIDWIAFDADLYGTNTKQFLVPVFVAVQTLTPQWNRQFQFAYTEQITVFNRDQSPLTSR